MNFNKAPKYPTWTDIPRWDGISSKTIEPWEKWFAWYPVVVHGKQTWLKTVYRRKIKYRADTYVYYRYHYGTLFDLLTD